MTEISRKIKQLATFCFSLFLIRLGFRAFGYDQLYHNPNDPYDISDLIEVALAIIYLTILGLCIIHALRVLLRHWDQGALGASALLAGNASNQLKWCLSIKAPITFSWSSTEREKQMVLRANRLMRVLSVRLLRSIRWVNIFPVRCISLGTSLA